MKRMNFKKITALLLAFTFIIGSIAVVGVSAEDDTSPKIEIVSKNVYYADTLKLMYAVYTENLLESDVVVLTLTDADGNSLGEAEPYEENGEIVTATVNGKTCVVYLANNGVPAQKIGTEFYAVASVVRDGESVASTGVCRYSVLEYLYERLTVSTGVSDEYRALYQGLISYAKLAETALLDVEEAESIANKSYVKVKENGTIDGNGTGGLYTVGTEISGSALTSTLIQTSDTVLMWNLATYDLNGNSTNEVISDTKMQDTVITVTESPIVITPMLQESAEMTLATFTFGDNGTASHSDGSQLTDSDMPWTDGNYSLTFSSFSKVYKNARDNNGTSALKLGTSSEGGSFEFTVPENITKVVILVAGYKANSAKIVVNNTETTITTYSNNGEYTAIEIDTSETKTVSLSSTTSKNRVMIDSITYWGEE